jgi:hypothetical protein
MAEARSDEQLTRDLYFGAKTPFLDVHRDSMRDLIAGIRSLEEIMFYSCNVRIPPIDAGTTSLKSVQILVEMHRKGHEDFPSIRRAVLAFLRDQASQWSALADPGGEDEGHFLSEVADFSEEVFDNQRAEWEKSQLLIARMQQHFESQVARQASEIYLEGVKENIEQAMRAGGHEIPTHVHVVLPAFAPGHDEMDELQEQIRSYLAWISTMKNKIERGLVPQESMASVCNGIAEYEAQVHAMQARLKQLEDSRHAQLMRDLDTSKRIEGVVHDMASSVPSLPDADSRALAQEVQERLEHIVSDGPKQADPQEVLDVAEEMRILLSWIDEIGPDEILAELGTELRTVQELLRNLEESGNGPIAARLRALRAHPSLYKAWVRGTASRPPACTGTRSSTACSARGSTAGCTTSRSRRTSCSSS